MHPHWTGSPPPPDAVPTGPPDPAAISDGLPPSGSLPGGGVSERPKENASKAFVGASPPRVQIPPPPRHEVALDLWKHGPGAASLSCRFRPAGERFRAALPALLLAENAPQLLMLDEPTNNLDLVSIEQLVSALTNYRGGMLVASHDEALLDRLEITRWVTASAGRLIDGPRQGTRRPG